MSSFYEHLSVHKIWIIKSIYIKIHMTPAPGILDRYNFLHRIYTPGVKIRPALNKFIFISQSGQARWNTIVKIIDLQNNHNC